MIREILIVCSLLLCRPVFSQFYAQQTGGTESSGVVFEEEPVSQAQEQVETRSEAENFPFTEGRDPFTRVLDNMGLTGDAYTREKYNLAEFTLIGLAWDTENPVALFKGPNGERHMLKKGDTIGRNNGVIKDISKGQVEIVETFAGMQKPTIMKVGRSNGNT